MDRNKKVETVDDNELDNDWREKPKLVDSTRITVKEFRIYWKNFNNCGMEVWAELTWSDTAGN